MSLTTLKQLQDKILSAGLALVDKPIKITTVWESLEVELVVSLKLNIEHDLVALDPQLVIHKNSLLLPLNNNKLVLP
jgi:hypothetical protein